MKFTLATAVTALAGIAAAKDVQSKPFKLQIQSDDKSLNGKYFTACHTGAALESFCIYDDGDKFYFNYEKGASAAAKGLTPSGKLIFKLPVGDKPIPSPMELQYDPSTNLAMALLQPGDDYTEVSFTDDKNGGKLRITTYYDDTTKKPTVNEKAKALNRWYVCATNYLGYNYKTLNWVLGNQKPQNPTCKKVDVVRKF